MSVYEIGFSNYINPSETNKLQDMLSIMDANDELNITIDSNNENISFITEVLYSNYFDVTFDRSDRNGFIRICATRKDMY